MGGVIYMEKGLTTINDLPMTKREKQMYRASKMDREPVLPANVIEDLYRLYQSGKGCEEICELNPKYTLGQIVRARVDNEWDDRKKEYLETLVKNAEPLAKQVAIESIGFIGTFLSVVHQHDQHKLQRFIQTRDKAELDGAIIFDTGTLKIYKEMLDMFLRATGNHDTKRVIGSVQHTHTMENTPKESPLTAEEAAAILAIQDGKK
jgi:hypothetical protein